MKYPVCEGERSTPNAVIRLKTVLQCIFQYIILPILYDIVH